MTTASRPYDAVKRGLDVAGALVLLLLLAPLLAVTAIAVLAALGRPVLFVQTRTGRDARTFALLKFRSMTTQPLGAHLDDAARLTGFGRILRATSLDELPSLVNVLRGDMSFVGPRPLLPEYLDRYTAREARRHEVRPGITGLAQVSGRNHLDWPQRLSYDVDYVDSRSFTRDVRILVSTVGVVLRREGVSEVGSVTMSPLPSTRETERP